MTDFTMTIDGEAVAAAESFPVLNPATEEVYAEAPKASAEQLERAIAAARAALPDWSADEEARREAMRGAAEVIDAAAAEIVPVLTAEQGKPLSDSGFEAELPGRWLRHYAEVDIPTEVLQDDETALSRMTYRPLGVVAAVTPWNFPLYQAIEKIAPAIRTGNTIVVKPSPYTPLTTLMLGELLREVLPAGVVNVVSGDDALGAALVSHPAPRKLAFTGSAATGSRVAAAGAPDMKRLTLELGGNDPAIVLDDADPAAIAPKIFWTAFGNCGQICNAVKRVYVPSALHDELVAALVECATAAKVGDGAAEGTQIGPLNNKAQYERVKELTADAIEAGAEVACGGGPLAGPGFFFAPTVLTGVGAGVRVVDEEQFGPVLPVIAYDDLDAAVAAANDTEFGLAASVWSADDQRAEAVAARIEAGTVGINSHMIGGENIPFGGIKASGVGLANGLAGMLAYTQPTVINTARGWEGVELPAALEATA